MKHTNRNNNRPGHTTSKNKYNNIKQLINTKKINKQTNKQKMKKGYTIEPTLKRTHLDIND